jgi:hypothetical protein
MKVTTHPQRKRCRLWQWYKYEHVGEQRAANIMVSRKNDYACVNMFSS